MNPGHWLLIAIALFVAVVLIVRFTIGRQWRLPKGRARATMSVRIGRMTYEVTVIADSVTNIYSYLIAYAATYQVAQEYADRFPDDKWRSFDHAGLSQAVIHVCDDTRYDKLYDKPRNVSSNGMTLSIGRKFGRGRMPLFAIRERYQRDADGTPGLVIHEALHHMAHLSKAGEHQHESADIWGSDPGDLELLCRIRFKDIFGIYDESVKLLDGPST